MNSYRVGRMDVRVKGDTKIERARLIIRERRTLLDNVLRLEAQLDAELAAQPRYSRVWWRKLGRISEARSERLRLETWHGWRYAAMFGIEDPRRGVA